MLHRSAMAAALGCFVTGCIAGRKEVARVRSPAGTADAVVIETDVGATRGLGYVVYVVPAGERATPRYRVATLYGAARNEQAYGVRPRWTGPAYLRVEYFTALDVEHVRHRIDFAGEPVQVSLRDSVLDPAAPSGGMAHARMLE